MDLKKYIGNQIKTFRKSAGFTQDELAKRLNTTKQTISRYEKGERKANQDMLFKLCDIFNVSIDDFFPVLSKNAVESTNSIPDDPDLLTQQITDKVVQLTTQNKKIVLRTSEELLESQEREVDEERFEYHVFEKLSAGTGYGYAEDRNYDTVYFEKDITHDLASWVYGDSMEPDFADGSVALIKDTGWDYDGAIYAVDWDGQSYIKKVYKEKDGLRLVSLNDKYDDKFARWEEDPRIIGKVVGNFMPTEN
ncbi:XRE family transcriptional regulator [Streptococcus sp. BJSWXB6CM1]|uniref:XRE family transcriptional regulator n=1 Tax=Streptococcus fermentans TaxID=3095082 RepID=A0ABU5FZI4_9STRE|nr:MULTISPECIES: XRE family transcriptional regulator [unclassified Streptococcus]MDY4346544.1 XRE family transcriptional regulator [Streptococcus sp. BJSWXB5TM5]MDY4360886.1 XRE family transcriptional regulator [Streptococcus sp. BJSWXB3CM3]MDY4371140.1 XRE family transcriptional regulator [Streptococcus sp. BJSWXB6CM1]DAW79097.1 MAG TPA: Repressor protein CI [Caudoviricetes sp.]